MLKEKVLEIIKRDNLIEENDKIVLGVSGGPDSISMFYVLNELTNILKFKIFVAHINHGIREAAIEDEKYVEEWCQQFNVPFFSLKCDIKNIAKKHKQGIEETGRIIRYEFFNEIAEKVGANKIGLAHNQNDNAETIIMNIIRGCGSKGLCGMSSKQGIYIRPLIEISRDDIEKYCKDKKLNPRIDKTNFENDYTRNKIRNIVIPYIKSEFNPNIINSLKRLSDNISEQEYFISEETIKYYKNILINEIKSNKNEYNTIILDLKKFNEIPKIIEKKILLHTIQILFGTTKRIEKVHLDDIVKLCNNNIGNKFLTPNKYLKIVIKNKQIHIYKLN